MEKNGFLILPHPLTNFKIQRYYQNEPRCNGVYSRDNLPNIRDGAYVINLDEYSDIRTHWAALYVQNNNVIYSILLVQNIFQKKLKHLVIVLCPLLCKIKILKQIFSEYKHMIQ